MGKVKDLSRGLVFPAGFCITQGMAFVPYSPEVVMSAISFDLSPSECEALPWHDRIAGYAVYVHGSGVQRRIAEFPVTLPHGAMGFPLAHALRDKMVGRGVACRVRVLYRDGSEEA